MKLLRRPKIYHGWWIVFTGYLTQLATVGASGWIFGILILPMQAELGWSRSTIVGVLTMERLLGGLFGFCLGPLVDRHGARLLMTLSAAAAGACLIGVSLVQHPWQSYVLWAAFGLSMPGLSTLGPVVAISNWFIRKRAQAILFYTFGSATAGLVLAPTMAAVADETSWRLAWVIMGLLLWTVVPLAWLTVRHRPEDLGLLPDGGEATPQGEQVRNQQLRDEPEAYWTIAKAVRSRSFWLLTLGFMLTSLPASSIFIHISSYVQSKGFSVETGAGAVSMYGLGALAGRFVWGFAVAQTGMYRALVAYGAVYGTSIILFALPNTVFGLYSTAILLGISIAGAQQLRAQAYPDFFGRRIVGTLLGYAGVVGTITGASAPLLVAIAYDQTGSYSTIFVVFGICCMVASTGFFFSRPRLPGRQTATALAEA